MKNFVITVLVLIILALVGVYVIAPDLFRGGDSVRNDATSDATQNETNVNDQEEEMDTTRTVIGQSVENRDITAYHYGEGETELLFVGGIHGGYEWNTVLVAYELMDYLEENPDVVPDNVKVTVVPVLNPDGLNETVGTDGRFARRDVPANQDDTIPGRFNAHDVDLNRNFDCDWQEEGVWQSRAVSGGTEAFSEPESRAIRDYVLQHNPEAVVVWYSAAGGVFASNCHNGVLEETRTLTNLYADASGYPAYESFNFYKITGDMVNWLAKEGIPGISVLLTTHSDVEWEENREGIEALIDYYAQQ